MCCCQTKAELKPVSKSVAKLSISTFAAGAYQVIIKTIPETKQYVQRLSTVAGALEIDMALPTTHFWNADLKYNLTFIQDDDYSNNKTFTLDGETFDCAEFTVVQSYGTDDTCYDFEDQTAELCNS